MPIKSLEIFVEGDEEIVGVLLGEKRDALGVSDEQPIREKDLLLIVDDLAIDGSL